MADAPASESRYDVIVKMIVEQFEESSKNLKEVSDRLKNLTDAQKTVSKHIENTSKYITKQTTYLKKLSSTITGLVKTIVSSWVPKAKNLLDPILQFNILAPRAAKAVDELNAAIERMDPGDRFISLAGAAKVFAEVGRQSFASLYIVNEKYRDQMLDMSNQLNKMLGPKGAEVVSTFFKSFKGSVLELDDVMRAFVSRDWSRFEAFTFGKADTEAISAIMRAYKGGFDDISQSLVDLNSLTSKFQAEMEQAISRFVQENSAVLQEMIKAITAGVIKFFEYIRDNRDVINKTFKDFIGFLLSTGEKIKEVIKWAEKYSSTIRKVAAAYIGLRVAVFAYNTLNAIFINGLINGAKYIWAQVKAVIALVSAHRALALAKLGIIGLAAWGGYEAYKYVAGKGKERETGMPGETVEEITAREKAAAAEQAKAATFKSVETRMGGEEGIKIRADMAEKWQTAFKQGLERRKEEFKNESDALAAAQIAATQRIQEDLVKTLQEKGIAGSQEDLLEAVKQYGGVTDVISRMTEGVQGPAKFDTDSLAANVEMMDNYVNSQKLALDITSARAEQMQLTGQQDKRWVEDSERVRKNLEETAQYYKHTLELLEKEVGPNRDIKAIRETQVKLAQTELAMMKTRIDLIKQSTAAEESRLSLAESEEAIYKTQLDMMEAVYGTPALAVESMTRIIGMLEVEKNALREIYEKRKQARLEAEAGGEMNAELRRLEMQAANDLQKKELERLQLVKKLRDGYIDAVQAASYGVGALNKLLITREQNIGLGERMGAVRKNFLLGLVQEPGAKQVASYRYGRYGGFERTGGGAFGKRELAERQATMAGRMRGGYQEQWFEMQKELSRGTMALTEKTSNNIDALLANTKALYASEKSQDTMAAMFFSSGRTGGERLPGRKLPLPVGAVPTRRPFPTNGVTFPQPRAKTAERAKGSRGGRDTVQNIVTDIQRSFGRLANYLFNTTSEPEETGRRSMNSQTPSGED